MSMQTVAADCRKLLAKPDLSPEHRREATRILREAEGPQLTDQEKRILEQWHPQAESGARMVGCELVLSPMTEGEALARLRELRAQGVTGGAPVDLSTLARMAERAR